MIDAPKYYSLPLILCDDYEAFVDLIGSDFPDTYSEWLGTHQTEKAALEDLGHMVEEVPIESSAFDRYCNALGLESTQTNLLRYVRETD